jgi:hypothetical protein
LIGGGVGWWVLLSGCCASNVVTGCTRVGILPYIVLLLLLLLLLQVESLMEGPRLQHKLDNERYIIQSLST